MACANIIGRIMNDFADQPASEPKPLASPEAVEKAPDARSSSAGWRNPWLIVALLALALAGWQWFETRARLAETQQEIARRLSESDTVAKESHALSRLAQEQMAALQGKLGELEGKIAESKSQQESLETLYQDLARNREEWALTEIEQGVALASQQLQLAGNVQGAVLALQSAEARLAGNPRPQFMALRKVLLRDLERLHALPQLDLAGMNRQLEGVISAVDSLPLAVDGRPRDTDGVGQPQDSSSVSMTSLSFWQQMAAEFWGELRSLIRIQRFDREEPALLAPGQDFFLRENLKLRLLNARLALMAHDQWAFRNELKQIRLWLDRYFDGQEPSVQAAREMLVQLSAAAISIELPSLNDSLSAIKNFKLGKDRK